MIRFEAIPWIAAAVIILAALVAVMVEPRSRWLQGLELPRVTWRRPRAFMVGVLVAVDAKRDDRRRRAQRNGKPSRAELEAIASVELDREARQS
jgi:hypothetical protein